MNYKFVVLLPDRSFIDITKLDNIIRSNQFLSPFRILFTTDDCTDVRKLSVIFEFNGKKICFILWPSGKSIIMSAGNIDNAFKIYDFLCDIFTSVWDNIVIPLPIPDED